MKSKKEVEIYLKHMKFLKEKEIVYSSNARHIIETLEWVLEESDLKEVKK